MFAAARADRRACLLGYLPAGFPSYAASLDAFDCLVEGGVDIVEVGLPYSDPLLDGPIIQQAVDRALAAGTTPADVLRVVEHVAARGVPTVVMTYWNPVESYGVAAFARAVASAGAAGVITPDLTPDEGGAWVDAALAAGIDPVFLVAPSSSDARLRLVAASTRGFVYAASTMGVTGARAAVSASAADLVSRVRAVTDLPVAVGLGVSTREQAATVARFADGVIVGSALVETVLTAPAAADGRQRLATLVADLAAGVRRS
ncbi:MAG: tryptophan synthase subunit alpha [Mycobacteriales bacterium]|nr:tryptophan synthase subunit alpha [Frankia sp.]